MNISELLFLPKKGMVGFEEITHIYSRLKHKQNKEDYGMFVILLKGLRSLCFYK